MEQVDLPKVKVINPGEGCIGTECYINGQKIMRVKSVDFHVGVNEIPEFDFEMYGITDIDMFGDIRFSFTPKTVEDSVKVLRNELMKHEDVYNGFKASIITAIKEIDNDIYINELAEDILKRIMGDE